MSIRQKLGIVFTLLAVIMLTLAGLFVTGGPIMVQRFSRSLDAMDMFNLIRDFRSALGRRHSNMNTYLLLGETPALNNFEDFSREAKSTLERILRMPNASESAEITALNTQYLLMEKSDERLIKLYQSGDKANALTLADADSFPQYDKFFTQIKKLEDKKRKEAQENFNAFRHIAEKGAIIILLATTLAIGLTLAILQNLYATLMKPLEILRRGVLELGQGHWDHRITVPAKDEFDTLAQAFNTMAGDIRQLQLQTIHMERMSTVGQLAGGVAHELNNPLTGVLGNAQLLLANTPPDTPEHVQLQKIEQAALRCKVIVRGLLDFSRPQEGQLQSASINELLNSTLELCETDIKASKIGIEKKLDSSLSQVSVNVPQIEQVILNLLTNALHATKEGGKITIQTQNIKDHLTLADRRMGNPPQVLPGPWVRVSISDTGHGIPPEILNKIFEPFYTTKEIGKGTGLGLSIALGIVRKHGGDIRAESGGSGKGATFHVYLPVPAAGTSVAAPPTPRFPTPA